MHIQPTCDVDKECEVSGNSSASYPPSMEDASGVVIHNQPLNDSDFMPIYSIARANSPPVNIFSSCISGLCACSHTIGGKRVDLKPCRLANFLFGYEALYDLNMSEKDYLWYGFNNGSKLWMMGVQPHMSAPIMTLY